MNKFVLFGLLATSLLAIGRSGKADIIISPLYLTNNVMYGYNAPDQSFVATNTGSTKSVWALWTQNWFDVSPSNHSVPSNSSYKFTLSYSNLSLLLPPNTYTGQVVFSNGSMEKVVIATGMVYLGIMQLNAEPANISTGIMAGGSIAPRNFQVWNSGGGSFNYTAQPVGDATNFFSLSGATNSTAGSNTITVNFVQDLPSAAYSGTIAVVSSDGGGATNYVSVAANVWARPTIELNPLVITQTVALKDSPETNIFTVRNSSGGLTAPMAYTLTVSNGSRDLIAFVAPTDGVNTGQAQDETIHYTDLGASTGGLYNASVRIDGVDAGTGYWPTGQVHVTTNLIVQIYVTVPTAPTGITASSGTYANYVTVSWEPVPNMIGYKIYRSVTFDSSQAEPIGSPSTTTFNDQSGMAGVIYYYWVSSVNAYGGEGPMSTDLHTGYRRLAAPGGIFATDGTFTDRVRVSWPLVDGATGYRVYRGIEGGSMVPVYFTAGAVFDDMAVESGVHYAYRVGATNGVFGSELSVSEIGYSFGTPSGLYASEGAYVGKVRLTWNALEAASGYEIWRSTRTLTPPAGGASLLGTVYVTTFDDTSMKPGEFYYYWIRGVNIAAGSGNLSIMARGYAAVAGVNLWVDDFVVLPVQIGAGSSPSIISFRMGNGGGADMTGANGNVGIEFYASTNSVFGVGNEIYLGETTATVSLTVGSDTVVNVNGTRMTLPSVEGNYYIFVRVLPKYPSLLAETATSDNVAKRAGITRVRSSGGFNYQAFNDYDGDGISDLGVYRNNEWNVQSVDGRILVSGAKLFSAGRPVLGDLDGDRRSDPIVYDSNLAMWQALFSARGYGWIGGVFGGPGYLGLTADYEGVGHGDASIYLERDGRWYILLANGRLIAWNWGGAGYQPVTGDFNCDGCWDMAVYQNATGLWYAQTLYGQLIFSSLKWGGAGYLPVPGDFDGDGYWDLAVYQESSGLWFIKSTDGKTITSNIPWGGPGFQPVTGDYDGDGKWDLCVYHEATGLWYIRTVDARVLAWASPWGGPGYRPIGN